MYFKDKNNVNTILSKNYKHENQERSYLSKENEMKCETVMQGISKQWKYFMSYIAWLALGIHSIIRPCD